MKPIFYIHQQNYKNGKLNLPDSNKGFTPVE